MNHIRLIDSFFLFLLCTNVNALELTYTGKDCYKENHPILQSKITITNQVGNYFSVQIQGGLPVITASNTTCIDNQFKRYIPFLAPFPLLKHITGTILYSAPYVYLFTEGQRIIGSKSTAPISEVFTFILSNNKLTLIRTDSLGQGKNTDLQPPDNDVYISESEIYNKPDLNVVYTLSQ
jgi:hypothetical protein